MERLLNLMLDILDSREIKDDYDLACYIWELTHEEEEDNILNIFKEIFESLDVNIEDEEEYIDYLTESIEQILCEIEEYTRFRLTDMHDTGYKFIRDTEDKNKFYPDPYDFLQDDWIDIYELEEELDSEHHAAYLCGNMPSKKKDRSIVKFSKEELEW